MDAPREVIGSAWQRSVVREDGSIDIRTYTFCTLDRLANSIGVRDGTVWAGLSFMASAANCGNATGKGRKTSLERWDSWSI